MGVGGRVGSVGGGGYENYFSGKYRFIYCHTNILTF